jgi:hypothetical protein
VVNDGGAHGCTSGPGSLCHKGKGAATLPDLIDDQDRAPLQRFIWRHARNGWRWATAGGIVVFGDGNQEIANAESIGEHRARHEATATDGKDGIRAML